jgi:hypothetical protein
LVTFIVVLARRGQRRKAVFLWDGCSGMARAVLRVRTEITFPPAVETFLYPTRYYHYRIAPLLAPLFIK